MKTLKTIRPFFSQLKPILLEKFLMITLIDVLSKKNSLSPKGGPIVTSKLDTILRVLVPRKLICKKIRLGLEPT